MGAPVFFGARRCGVYKNTPTHPVDGCPTSLLDARPAPLGAGAPPELFEQPEQICIFLQLAKESPYGTQRQNEVAISMKKQDDAFNGNKKGLNEDLAKDNAEGPENGGEWAEPESGEIKNLRDALEGKDKECAEALDKFMRKCADFDNYKKRVEKEKIGRAHV